MSFSARHIRRRLAGQLRLEGLTNDQVAEVLNVPTPKDAAVLVSEARKHGLPAPLATRGRHPSGPHPSTPVTPDAGVDAEQRLRVLTLRAQDLTYREIGEALGVSRQRAHQIVTEALRPDKDTDTDA